MSSTQLAPTWSENSKFVINRHAKSFSWAAALLPRKVFRDVAAMYHFCRFVDDVADEMPADRAKVELALVVAAIQDPLSQTNAPVKLTEILKMFRSRGVRGEWVEQLILGVQSDLMKVDLENEQELLRYTYRVAGVVGLMMCPVLGVANEKAWAHAIDLGVAMQLSNIARDIEEDRQRGRIYIPKTWRSLEPYQQVRQLIELSNRYYQSARDGYRYLPWHARISIAVAARLYQEIGKKVLHQWPESSTKRVSVSHLRKIWLTVVEVLKTILVSPKVKDHQPELHVELRGLPGVAH